MSEQGQAKKKPGRPSWYRRDWNVYVPVCVCVYMLTCTQACTHTHTHYFCLVKMSGSNDASGAMNTPRVQILVLEKSTHFPLEGNQGSSEKWRSPGLGKEVPRRLNVVSAYKIMMKISQKALTEF